MGTRATMTPHEKARLLRSESGAASPPRTHCVSHWSIHSRRVLIGPVIPPPIRTWRSRFRLAPSRIVLTLMSPAYSAAWAAVSHSRAGELTPASDAEETSCGRFCVVVVTAVAPQLG